MNARMLFNLRYLFSNDKMPEVLALSETASFFACLLFYFRTEVFESKKDIVESRTDLDKNYYFCCS